MSATYRRWHELELAFESSIPAVNPYTDLAYWVDFTHESGHVLRRPAFWDGGSQWRVRFAPPWTGRWSWQGMSDPHDEVAASWSGQLKVEPTTSSNRFHRHGLLKMSPGRRNVIHHDGKPFLMVADTAWGLPFRATHEQCRDYAWDRRRKGFNAALLLSVEPDMNWEAPRDRGQYTGFDIGFEDLSSGHLNELNVAYFQYLDKLVEILVEHEIAPVWSPIFHGYGWKGGPLIGRVVDADEYARYCRYLVARYGARPSLYLLLGDGHGKEPGIEQSGREVERWDAYQQPTGLHYNPFSNNRAWQDCDWLDFQWCQTGHQGEHIPERVADMRHHQPIKAVANGEPTYERTGDPDRATGWWQGHEAWSNLCAGGTMGVVYGAGSLALWRLAPDEPGWENWCHARDAGWREALDFEGSRYVGAISKILDGLPLTDMQANWDYTVGGRNLIVRDKLMIKYLERGGEFQIISDHVPRTYRIIDPKTAQTISQGELPAAPGWHTVDTQTTDPRVAIFH